MNEEFDYQWNNLPSSSTEYSEDRVNEILKFTKLNKNYFKGKKCLDVGCGNGRYTYAMLKLGAEVTSIDISNKAVDACKQVNPNTRLIDIMEFRPNPIYDFVLCWGVLHHLEEPHQGFRKVASQVKPGGILHIMVYHKDTQKIYEEGRRIWHTLNREEKLNYCNKMIDKYGGNLHGWWDAFNPKYNWSYTPKEIKEWFKEEVFKKIKQTQKYNINMKGVKEW